MKHATLEDFDEIKRIFKDNRQFLPHIRTDYIRNRIERGQVIVEDGVVIIYNIYKRKQRLGTVEAKKGDCVLKQIVAKYRNGSALGVFSRFCKYVNTDVYLSVRVDNPARKFYSVGCGMKLIGEISWAKGELLGEVYLKEKACNP